MKGVPRGRERRTPTSGRAPKASAASEGRGVSGVAARCWGVRGVAGVLVWWWWWEEHSLGAAGRRIPAVPHMDLYLGISGSGRSHMRISLAIFYTAIPGSLGICWAADSKDSDGFRWHQLIRPD
ncbi:hypothetical protein DFH08DRAFT_814817 [Mycena albidolilacea]|uniref:Uncharacterized protein n=1 Tax=Mycena albidolilacea TaxID=1033008 RepID=A0AAD6ZP47_9AGAR|nr:hypothetical protein DFH08DRAFT_814817 [Mycena albidolilacea]